MDLSKEQISEIVADWTAFGEQVDDGTFDYSVCNITHKTTTHFERYFRVPIDPMLVEFCVSQELSTQKTKLTDNIMLYFPDDSAEQTNIETLKQLAEQ